MTLTLPIRTTTYIAAGLSLAVAVNLSVLFLCKRESVALEYQSMSTGYRFKSRSSAAQVSPERDTLKSLGDAVLGVLDVQPPERPVGQKLALLTMLWNNNLAQEAKDILQRMTGVRATPADYAALLRDRLTVPRAGTRWADLSPMGDYKARQIASELAVTHGLHHFSTNDGRFDVMLYCSCGRWSTAMSKNHGHLESQAGRGIRKHLREVDAGPQIPRGVRLDRLFETMFEPETKETVDAEA